MNLQMDRSYLKKVLVELLNIPSPTGYTDDIVRYVCQALTALNVDYELTRRGAIRATLSGKQASPDRAIVAHVDTLGAIIKMVKDNGRCLLVPIGTWSSRFAEGARVKVHSAGRTITGTILPLLASGHVYDRQIDTLPVSWDNLELRLDERVNSEEDTRQLGVRIGDFVSIDSRVEISESGYINARHLDDKAGVAAVLTAIKAIKDSGASLPVDCHPLFTISEEEGSGASSILHQDVAAMVAVDNATLAPGQNSSEFGVTVCMRDSGGPYDYHLTQHILSLCKANNIEYKRDIFNYYKSDSSAAIDAGNDIRTALVCFSVDASHGYERSHFDSIESVAKLLKAYMLDDEISLREKRSLSGLEGFPK